MDWATELRGFAIHAVVALAALAALRSGFGRGLLARVAAAVGAWSPRKALVVVLLVTAGVRGVAMTSFSPPDEGDTREYVEKAALIAEEGSPRAQEERVPGRFFYRPLGYSLPLAGWFKATGTRGIPSARVFGIVLACVAAWLIVVLGRTIGSATAGRLAALGYALYLPHVAFAVIPYTETFVTVLVLAAAIAFERLRRGPGGLGAAAGLGVSLGWIAITRTEMAFLLPLAAVLLVALKTPGRARRVVVSAVAAACFVVPLAVNHEIRDGYPGHLRTSVQGGLILYFGNNPIEVNGYGNATPEVQAKVREMYAADPSGGTARDAAIAWMKAHPGEVLVNAPKKLFHLWLVRPQGFRWHAGTGTPSGLSRGVAAAAESVAWAQSLLVLFAGGAALVAAGAFRGARRFWTLSLLLHAGVWCLLASSARNRYPLEPWLLLAWASAVAPPSDGDESAT